MGADYTATRGFKPFNMRGMLFFPRSLRPDVGHCSSSGEDELMGSSSPRLTGIVLYSVQPRIKVRSICNIESGIVVKF